MILKIIKQNLNILPRTIVFKRMFFKFEKNYNEIIITFFFCFIFFEAFGQVNTPPASPRAKISQQVGTDPS